MKTKGKIPSLSEQLAQCREEMKGVMDRGESPTGNGRLTARTIEVLEPDHYDAQTIRDTRESLNVSQAVFAQLMGVSAVLVRAWERGVRSPAPVACRLLDEIRQNPSRFLRLIRVAG